MGGGGAIKNISRPTEKVTGFMDVEFLKNIDSIVPLNVTNFCCIYGLYLCHLSKALQQEREDRI